MRFSSLSTEADEIKTISPFNLAVKIVTSVFHVDNGRAKERGRGKGRENKARVILKGELESTGNE